MRVIFLCCASAILHDLSKPSTSSFPDPVSDKMSGFLQTSFIVSYMLLSPVFGYLGDRWTRKYIIGIGIIFWSLFTLAGSFSVVGASSAPTHPHLCTVFIKGRRQS